MISLVSLMLTLMLMPEWSAGRMAAVDATAAFHHGLVTKLRLKPPSNDEQSVREPSLLGSRCAAAKTASKASRAKTCFISPEHGFRRCLGETEECTSRTSTFPAGRSCGA